MVKAVSVLNLDVITLSRIQFAGTIMFHYLFPPLTIGLGGLLVSLEWKFLRTADREYEEAAKFWTKIFAINFAVGVATGIVMEFEFGTNWAAYSRYVGDVFGSALAAEGIFAFFLESGFLAVLVFGWEKVSRQLHFFATCMVALGALFSSIWIVVANSWQQTPVGFHLVGTGPLARAEVTEFWSVVFNPSTIPRLLHVWIAAYLLGAFFVMSISAYYLLRRRHIDFARKSFTSALSLATAMSLAALIQGDLQAKKVAVTQPAKLAAMEAHFETGAAGSPLYLFGFPDQSTRTVRHGLAVPELLSWLATGRRDQAVAGLDKFPLADWPPVALTFHSFHLMIWLGMFFLGITLFASYLRWRGRLFAKRWLLWVFVAIVPLPYLANEAGWATAEVGRQPWVVYGQMRTSQAVSKAIGPDQVLGSILAFLIIYALLFAVWIFVLDRKIRQGPEPVGPSPASTAPDRLIDIAGQRSGTGGKSLTDEEPIA